jgi:hypothetical protein
MSSGFAMSDLVFGFGEANFTSRLGYGRGVRLVASRLQAWLLVFLGRTFPQRSAFYKPRGHSVVRYRTETQASRERIGARNGNDKQKGTARATRRQESTLAPVVASGVRYVDAFPVSPAFYGCVVPLAFRAKLPPLTVLSRCSSCGFTDVLSTCLPFYAQPSQPPRQKTQSNSLTSTGRSVL